MRTELRTHPRWLVIGFALALAALPVRGTDAHPHVFIDSVAFVEFDSAGKIPGVQLQWTFDDIFSFILLKDFDHNKDGRFDATETEALRKGAFEALQELNYFTHIRVSGELMRIDRVTDFAATVGPDKRVTYSFFVPFEQPVDPRAKVFDIGVYDETFYVAVAYDKLDPVRLSGPGSNSCHFKIMEDRQNPIYFGLVFPEKIDIICATS